jgi:hypothetical protein
MQSLGEENLFESNNFENRNGNDIVAYLRHIGIVTSKHAPAITQ